MIVSGKLGARWMMSFSLILLQDSAIGYKKCPNFYWRRFFISLDTVRM